MAIGGRLRGLGQKIGNFLGITMLPPPPVLSAQFKHLADEIGDFETPIHRVVSEVMAPSFRTNFEVGGRPAWQALSEATTEIRGSSGPILVRSGELAAAAGSVSLWEIDSAAGEAWVSGIDPFYGGLHQSGTVMMPAREWAVIQPEDAERIVDIFSEHVGDAIDRVKIGI